MNESTLDIRGLENTVMSTVTRVLPFGTKNHLTTQHTGFSTIAYISHTAHTRGGNLPVLIPVLEKEHGNTGQLHP